MQKRKCPLCGIREATEIHHIVPVAAGGDNSEENLIILCKVCHSILTPNSALTKIGLKKAKLCCELEEMHTEFYRLLQDKEPYDAVEVLDIFDEWFDSFCKKATEGVKCVRIPVSVITRRRLDEQN